MLLLIDTSQKTGTAALAKEGRVLFSEENKIAKEHAGWLHPAIGRLLAKAKITVRELEAVAVMAGPGSYTGLRVGMAAAKGFCYALKIPLITRNTLRVMAESMRSAAEERGALICPMIDARRDEVFTALYSLGQKPNAESQKLPTKPEPSIHVPLSTANGQRPTANDLTEILQPQALILDKNSFEISLSRNPIIFFGSGADKWKKLNPPASAIFESQPGLIQAFALLSLQDFAEKNWADPFYSEPVYLKEFFTY